METVPGDPPPPAPDPLLSPRLGCYCGLSPVLPGSCFLMKPLTSSLYILPSCFPSAGGHTICPLRKSTTLTIQSNGLFLEKGKLRPEKGSCSRSHCYWQSQSLNPGLWFPHAGLPPVPCSPAPGALGLRRAGDWLWPPSPLCPSPLPKWEFWSRKGAFLNVSVLVRGGKETKEASLRNSWWTSIVWASRLQWVIEMGRVGDKPLCSWTIPLWTGQEQQQRRGAQSSGQRQVPRMNSAPRRQRDSHGDHEPSGESRSLGTRWSYSSSSSLSLLNGTVGTMALTPWHRCLQAISTASGTQYSEYNGNVVTIKYINRDHPNKIPPELASFPKQNRRVDAVVPQSTPFGVKAPELKSRICY